MRHESETIVDATVYCTNATSIVKMLCLYTTKIVGVKLGSKLLMGIGIGEKKWQNNNKKALKSVDFNAFLNCGGRI